MSNNDNFFDSQSNLSKIKLDIYNDYIETYLFKILWTFKECIIWDLFSWPWITDDWNEWSPIKLLKIINKVLGNEKIKVKNPERVHIIFNDSNENNIKLLKEKIEEINYNKDIIKIYLINSEVWNLINDIKKININCAKFFFLDPFWYTEKSTWFSIDDLNDLMKIKYTEILLFNPLFFAYRWYKISQTTIKDCSNIENFKKDYGLDKEKNISDIYSFCKKIKDNLLSDNIKFVIPVLIDWWKSKNALFLLTNSIIWADLMIKTVARKTIWWWNDIKSWDSQLQLWWNFNTDFQPDYFLEYMNWFNDKLLSKIQEKWRVNNKYIIELRCKYWIHYKIAEDIIKKLEKEKKIKTTLQSKKSLYLDIKYFSEKENEKYTITINK